MLSDQMRRKMKSSHAFVVPLYDANTPCGDWKELRVGVIIRHFCVGVVQTKISSLDKFDLSIR
jgi:hypothetical protein